MSTYVIDIDDDRAITINYGHNNDLVDYVEFISTSGSFNIHESLNNIMVF